MFLGAVGFFLKKANNYYILFLGCLVRTKMVVHNPLNRGRHQLRRHQYGACQKLNLRKLHHYCKHRSVCQNVDLA